MNESMNGKMGYVTKIKGGFDTYTSSVMGSIAKGLEDCYARICGDGLVGEEEGEAKGEVCASGVSSTRGGC